MIVAAVYLNHLWDISWKLRNPWESRVCACRKCLADRDPWFEELMDSSPNPFLSKDHNTSEDEFEWWRRLQPGRGDFRLYNSTLDRLFEVIPPTAGVVGPSPGRCRTCAVVGNSGNLNGSHYGSLIDRNDVVIRMNQGPTEGYEDDVGSKTTHRVMYPHTAVKLDNSSRLVFFAYKIIKHGSLFVNVMVLNPAFMKYVHEALLKRKGRYPSTGFITVALSLQICDEVNVFGFGADKQGNWNHYFEKLKNKRLRTGQHAGNQEYKVIEELHNKQKIQLFVPQ
uniref:CMP-N-acetylneuraminate-beta-galactosamide-alpha-2,3-sialyltransferase 1 n=1 Tax=Salarias fasciatus TaxID=181472 RepID=A0A672GIJ0_SALFA